ARLSCCSGSVYVLAYCTTDPSTPGHPGIGELGSPTRPRDHETPRPRTARPRDRETARQQDHETARPRDRETARTARPIHTPHPERNLNKPFNLRSEATP